MPFHHAEIDHSIASDSRPPMGNLLLADNTLSDFHASKNAMSNPPVPGEFGNVEIDFGDQKHQPQMTLAAAENRPPTVSGPGCEFVIRQVPSPGFPNEHEVDVKPPKDGGSCVVVIPPRGDGMPRSDY
ncbi:MAG: hypothetical protein HY986_01240 [Candidatus Melainabacteria bacterium]|jgi:hypothetical protein|nr:hypothetical protein [Candidatus Melainabacteria bacterium]